MCRHHKIWPHIWGWGLEVPSLAGIYTFIILLVFNFPKCYGRNCVCPIVRYTQCIYNCCLISLVASIWENLFISFFHIHINISSKVNNIRPGYTRTRKDLPCMHNLCCFVWENISDHDLFLCVYTFLWRLPSNSGTTFLLSRAVTYMYIRCTR